MSSSTCTLPLVVVIGEHAARDEAERLAATLALPLLERIPADRCALVVNTAEITLQRDDGLQQRIDFRDGKVASRLDEPGLKRQPLARAIGIDAFVKAHRRPLSVTDGTAGFGQDAWLLAGCGATVLMLERLHWLYLLLSRALRDAHLDPRTQALAGRTTLAHADARSYCANHPDASDVVFLDPMYPPRRKSAKVGKGMQLLHALAGAPDDDPALLAAALTHARYRVVVKRPKGAARIAGSEAFDGQLTTVESPNTRYDIYHRRPLARGACTGEGD